MQAKLLYDNILGVFFLCVYATVLHVSTWVFYLYMGCLSKYCPRLMSYLLMPGELCQFSPEGPMFNGHHTRHMIVDTLYHDKITTHASDFSLITNSRYIFAWSITFHGRNISLITFHARASWGITASRYTPFPTRITHFTCFYKQQWLSLRAHFFYIVLLIFLNATNNFLFQMGALIAYKHFVYIKKKMYILYIEWIE